MPGMARSAVERRDTVEHDGAVANGARERAERRGAGRDDADLFERRVRELLWRGKKSELDSPLASRLAADWRSPSVRDAAGNRRRGLDRDCWPRIARTVTSNGSQAPGVRMPGCAATARFKSASPENCSAIDRRVGAEIEHAPHALDDGQQRARIAEPHFEGQRGALIGRPDRDRARGGADGDRPLIAAGLDELNARRGARREEADDLGPVVRRPVGETKMITTRAVDALCARACAARSASAKRCGEFRR